MRGEIRLPDGRTARQSWIRHRPCIAVVPVDSQGRLVLIEQYRHATGGMIVEIPAGNMDREGEDPEACTQRELAEEIGFKAKTLVKLFSGYLVPGYCDEYMHFFLACDLYPAQLPGDADEYIRSKVVTFAEAEAMMRDGRIRDVKTALGIRLAAAPLAQLGPPPADPLNAAAVPAFPARSPGP
jgi:ADP-ribose pyrophosphatase